MSEGLTVRRTDGYSDITGDTVVFDHEEGSVRIHRKGSGVTIPIDTVSSVIQGDSAGETQVIPA